MDKITIKDNKINEEKLRLQIIETHRDDKFFISKYKMIIKKYPDTDFIDVLDVIESLRVCDGCKALDECKQKHNGHYLGLDNSQVQFIVCKYLKKELAMKQKYHNIVYSDVEFKNELPNFDDLYIDISNRAELIKHVSSIIDNKARKGIYVYGSPGVGKTFIINYLVNKFIEKDRTIAFIKPSEFINKMSSLYETKDNDEKILYSRLKSRVKRVDLLVIDDIGSEVASQFFRDELLFSILDYRMEAKKMCVFTSNLNLEELEKHFIVYKKDNNEINKAKRIIERIRVLTRTFYIDNENSLRK